MKIISNFVFLFLLTIISFDCFSQPSNGLASAKQKLATGKSITDILTDPQFDSLRTETEFRDLIRSYSNQKVVTLVTDKEPGTKITIKGKMLDQNKQPLKNLLIYVYHTDTRGWYGSDRVHFQMMEGDRKHARLFAYLHTNEAGGFEFTTIQPHGYPQSELPAHIHFEVFNGTGQSLLITELLFDDDERLQGEIRSRSEKEKFLIAKPISETDKKVYNYTVILNQ